MNNFHYAISLAKSLYDIDGDLEDLEELGLIAYNFIGNTNTTLNKAILDVNCEDGSVQLPCGTDIIEAVTYCGSEDWNYTSNIYEYGDRYSLYSENYIESLKAFLDPHYLSGRFVKYRKVGDKLYVNKGLGRVQVLYHTEFLDEDGLPLINDKEAIAIADYIAYTITYKKALRSNNRDTFSIANDLKKKWLVHCDAARVAEHVSLNEMDAILNAKTSWGRKMYGKSLKPTL